MFSGKTILSTAICEQMDGEVIPVAIALKTLVLEMFPHIFASIYELNRKKREGEVINCDITNDHIRYISEKTGVPYEFVKEECAKHKTWYDVRDMLQFIGTNIIRKYNPDWHVQKLRENIINSPKQVVCVDDIRFPNERKVVEELGGTCFFVMRPQCEIMSNHSSETSIKWQDFDNRHIILNETDETFFINTFLDELKENFRYSYESPIFLSSNVYYTDYKTDFGVAKTETLKRILEQNKDCELFTKYGIITYIPESYNDKIDFVSDVYGFLKPINFCRNRYVVYNPLIFENIKFQLD